MILTAGAKIQSEEFRRTMLNIMNFLFPAMYRNATSRAGPNEMLSNMHEWFSTMQLMLPISYIADLDTGSKTTKKM